MQNSHAALKALEDARRKAPFVTKWKHWPATPITEAKAEIEAIADADWEAFLDHFIVVGLGYEGVQINQVMDWYEQKQAPFGEGKKEKEFPDAFSLAAAITFAKSGNTRIAVVSNDSDHIKACELHPELISYPDLATLTEAFIAEETAAIDSIKQAIKRNAEPLSAKIIQEFPDLLFFPAEDHNGDVSDVEVESVAVTDARVIEVVDDYCIIAFDANIHFSAYVSYDDAGTAIIDSSEDVFIPLRRKAGNVTESVAVSGTALLEFDISWRNILSAADVTFDTKDIEIQTRPSHYEYDEESEEQH